MSGSAVPGAGSRLKRVRLSALTSSGDAPAISAWRRRRVSLVGEPAEAASRSETTIDCTVVAVLVPRATRSAWALRAPGRASVSPAATGRARARPRGERVGGDAGAAVPLPAEWDDDLVLAGALAMSSPARVGDRTPHVS